MEHITEKINTRAKTIPNEVLRGLLMKMKDKNTEIISSGEDYYYLTDLCNPVKKYLERMHPSLIIFNSENEKAKIMGNKIHKIAEIWIKNMENFISSESKLDGSLVGAKVVGKIDAKVGESIIDFKSKINLPQTVEDVINKYPQDIEQLGFYTAIDPLMPKVNYLVFISQQNQQEMKVFKVTIKDHEKILEVLKQRINLLDGVKKGYVEKSKLGKCRYCNEESCQFKVLGLCEWESNEFNCDILDFVEIIEDKEYRNKLMVARAKWDNASELFTVNEIINGRKTLYNNSLEKIEEDWNEPIEKTLAKIYSSHIGYLVKKEYGKEIEEFPKTKINEIKQNRNWIKLKESKNPEGIPLPYVTCACVTKTEWYLKHLPTYKILELGIICAVHGISRGYIFEYLPNLPVKFRAFEVQFGELDRVIKEVNKIVSILKQNRIKNFEELLLCPNFFCGDCSIKEFCNKNQVNV